MLQAEQILQKNYQLSQKLSQNASRQTWLAQDLRTKESVVVKLLAFSDQIQWDNLKLFEREAQVLRQLAHPQIPKYRDYFCLDEKMLWFCLVQDYIPGISFKELLAQGKLLTEHQVRELAEAMLHILIYLHGLSPQVLHRDIKPSNILLGSDKQIYLVDFGAVQDRAATEGATFTVVGTYGYAPLEQFGGRATSASDLYALGATLIHLLTGVAPADLPQENARLQFADLVQLNPGFVRWLERLTEPNLEQRLAMAKEALAALKENEIAISAIASPQPHDSSIQLQKSAARLDIVIPGKISSDLKSFNTFFIMCGLFLLLGSVVYMLVSDPFTSFYLILFGSLLLGSGLLTACGETQVHFDSQSFAIEWKLLGLCLWQQRGRVAEIDRVLGSKTAHPFGNRRKQEMLEVALAVGVREYPFGRFEPPLTEAECRWLVEEINLWLGLIS